MLFHGSGKLHVAKRAQIGLNRFSILGNRGRYALKGKIDLQEGDRIFVPGQQNTVRISGAVLYPNTVIYVPGKSYRYYIDAAGGFSNNARRNKAFIIYMNGMSRPARGGYFDYTSKIEPGCEIVVPERGARTGLSAAEMMSMASSAASLTTMVATLVNIFR